MPNAAPNVSPSSRDRQLEEVAVGLEVRSDWPGVVKFVETWAAEGSPTPRARLAEAHAFHRLRLMDRALARLREVLDGEPAHPEALRLLAEVYLDRGWPVKARQPLFSLKEAGSGAWESQGGEVLWARAHAEAARPEAQAREIEREGNPARLLALAEAFLATGSFLRATGILERLRRSEPDNARVRDLLWGLAGDFSSGGVTLDSFLRKLGPRTLPPVDLIEEPENTESVPLERIGELMGSDLEPDIGSDDTRFPALFKHGRPTPAEPVERTENTESTQSSGLATADEMAGGGGEDTDAGAAAPAAAAPGGHGDTQIMFVLQNEEIKDLPPVSHRRREDVKDGLRETLNLRAYQQSMGMSPVGDSDLGDAGDDLLEEDDALVVLTRDQSAAPAEPEPPATFARPIEVVEKYARPVPPPPKPPPDPATDSAELPLDEPPAATGRNPVLWAIVAFGLALAVLVGAITLGSLGTRAAAASLRADLVRVLALEQYDALLREETELEKLAVGPDPAAAGAALAELRLVVWSEYNGDPARIEAVRATLAAPGSTDPHRIAVLRAAEALARADVSGASAAVSREKPLDDEEKLVFARLAAQNGDLARAMSHFESMERPTQPRYRLARARVLLDAGQRDEARKVVLSVLQQSPDHLAARLLSLELHDGEPIQAIAAANLFLAGIRGPEIPPRLEGRVHLLRALAYARMGAQDKAREAAEAGLLRDGTHPELLYLVAGDRGLHHNLLAALRDVESVVGARPGHGPAQAARVALLLDLDRVAEADAAVSALENGGMLGDLRPVLRTLVSVQGRGEPPPEGVGPLPATPLGAYTLALRAVAELAPSAWDAVESARAALAASPDAFERRLAPRMAGLRVLVAPREEVDGAIREAVAAAGEDPMVHVYLGRHFEGTGKRALAAQHFDRAPVLGPEYGIAWYEKGRFYSDARDGLARTGAAWRSYLGLSPSGLRAVRAGDKLAAP